MKKTVPIAVIALISIGLLYLFSKPATKTVPPKHLVSQLPVRYAERAQKKGHQYLIKDVTVIPMNRDTILPHQNVYVETGRIKEITSALNGANTTSRHSVIDGRGKYLIPGLNDMHVHVNDENNLLLFIANRVTTVRNMAGAPFHLELRSRIGGGEILGPAFYAASPILEGVDKVWEISVGLQTERDARDVVLRFKNEGYDFIKVYHTLPEDVYREVLRVGDSIDIPIIGHIPAQVDLKELLSSNHFSIEHAEVRHISPEIPLKEKEEMIGKSKKWMCPTLLVHKNVQKRPNDPSIPVHYEQYVDKDTRKFWRQRLRFGRSHYAAQKAIAGAIFRHGGRFVTGTDCLNSYVLAGFSIHEELQELVRAGLPEFAVLKASTVDAAEFLNRQDHIGTIEASKIADLILLDGNPLEDIANTKKINGVFVKGKWFSANELENMLNDVRDCYDD